MKKLLTEDRGFYWSNKAYYGEKDEPDSFTIGIFPNQGKNGTEGEMTIKWVRVNNEMVPRLECYFDATQVLATFSDFLAGVNEEKIKGNITPEQMKGLLLKYGFWDLTPYKKI